MSLSTSHKFYVFAPYERFTLPEDGKKNESGANIANIKSLHYFGRVPRNVLHFPMRITCNSGRFLLSCVNALYYDSSVSEAGNSGLLGIRVSLKKTLAVARGCAVFPHRPLAGKTLCRPIV